MARANEPSRAQCDSLPFRPPASTSQGCQRAREKVVASRDATQSSNLSASVERRSADVADSRSNSDRATARRCGQAHQLTHQSECDVQLCRVERAHVGVSHKCECLSRGARYVKVRCSASRRANASWHLTSRPSSSSHARARSIHQPHAGELDHVRERSRITVSPSFFVRTGMATRHSSAGASAPAKHARRNRSSQRNLLRRRAPDSDARDHRRDSS